MLYDISNQVYAQEVNVCLIEKPMLEARKLCRSSHSHSWPSPAIKDTLGEGTVSMLVTVSDSASDSCTDTV